MQQLHGHNVFVGLSPSSKQSAMMKYRIAKLVESGQSPFMRLSTDQSAALASAVVGADRSRQSATRTTF